MRKRLIEFIVLGVFALIASLNLSTETAEAKSRAIAKRAPASVTRAQLIAPAPDWVSLTPSEAADLHRELDERQRADFDADRPISRWITPKDSARTASTN